ncbi:hypothetical protein K7G98_39860, partial [Saccharothrix sp. MB29]|nr:hypothetical protein [Saccharothrix sp. MB29]
AWALTEDEIRAKLPETQVMWHKFVYRWTDQLFVNIEDHPDAVYLQVVNDTEVFPPEQVEAMLYEGSAGARATEVLQYPDVGPDTVAELARR